MTGAEQTSLKEPVLMHREGRVAIVEMNRPEAMNAMDDKLLKSLSKILKDISIEDSIDVVILKGAGKAFSAGGDIKMMTQIAALRKKYGLRMRVERYVNETK